MHNLSNDFTSIFHEGKEREFHDELLEISEQDLLN